MHVHCKMHMSCIGMRHCKNTCTCVHKIIIISPELGASQENEVVSTKFGIGHGKQTMILFPLLAIASCGMTITLE